MAAGPAPLVTIGIPAYNSTGSLEAAVESALAQDYPCIRLVVSVDESTDGTAGLAQRLAARHGFDVVVQPKRLGWIGNSNAVLALMGTPYGMILPHDDELAPTYVSRCVAALMANESAVVACSDIEVRPGGGIVSQAEFTGDRVDRVAACIEHGFAGVMYRGVVRLGLLPRRGLPHTLGGYAADSLWMLRMAIVGDIIRVPLPLYVKNLHPTSIAHGWLKMSARQEDRRWLAHTAEAMLLLLRDAPLLLRHRRIRDALRTRAQRLGTAQFRRANVLAGWTARLPMTRAWVEYARLLLHGARSLRDS